MGGVPSDKQPEKSVATLRGSVLVVGTLASFVLFGVAQEALTKTKYGKDEEKFGFTTFLVVLQSAGNALVAGMLLLVSYGSKAELTGGVPLKEWIIVALAYLGAHKFGLWSLLYIPFPLQVMTKSCKTVPVMLGEIILAGAKPGAQKIVSVLVMTAGIGIFLVYKPSKKGVSGAGLEMTADTALGLGLVLAALVCDGVYGPYQNRICKEAKAKSGEDLSPYHLMFNMNFYQGVFALVMVGGKVATGGKNELVSKSQVQDFVTRNPDVMPMLIQFSFAMALGNIFIYQLQRDFGALVVTTTTTFRKFLSVLASSLPTEGLCKWVPLLPHGVCDISSFPGCALISCATISGFGNAIAPIQWVGVALVICAKPTATTICAVTGLDAPKSKVE